MPTPNDFAFVGDIRIVVSTSLRSPGIIEGLSADEVARIRAALVAERRQRRCEAVMEAASARPATVLVRPRHARKVVLEDFSSSPQREAVRPRVERKRTVKML